MAGIVGGIVGGGGGAVTVPALDKLTSLRRAEIHGTSTVAIVFVAIAGLSFYLARGGRVDLLAGLGMITGGMFGAPVGARFAMKSSEALLRMIFILVLAATAVDLFAHAAGSPGGVVHPLIPAGLLGRRASVLIIAL